MPQIVLDALSHQAIRQAGSEEADYGLPSERAGLWRDKRLSGAMAALAEAGHVLRIARPTESELATASILLIASRSQLFPFTADELGAIRRFVVGGGGLWLMANHRLFVMPQQQVATELELPLRLNDITISKDPPLATFAHRVTEGCGVLRVRNASTITAGPQAAVIAAYAADERHAFAVAVDGDAGRQGRVLVTADSGFIASNDDKGRPMFESGANARFFSNAIAWLLPSG